MIPDLTQLEMVRKKLLTKGEITSWGAIEEFRISRLSQYIYLLRKKEGYGILSIRENNKETKKRWVRYVLQYVPKGCEL